MNRVLSLETERTVFFPTCFSKANKGRYIHIDQETQLVVQRDNEDESSSRRIASAIRTRQPIDTRCGIYYYEVTILDQGEHGEIGVGVCLGDNHMDLLPGWEPFSYGYHGDDGKKFHPPATEKGKGIPYGPCFTKDDVVGCLLNFIDGTVAWTKNGSHLGVGFTDLASLAPHAVFPMVGLRSTGESVRANFGASPFTYDIQSYIERARAAFLERFDRETEEYFPVAPQLEFVPPETAYIPVVAEDAPSKRLAAASASAYTATSTSATATATVTTTSTTSTAATTSESPAGMQLDGPGEQASFEGRPSPAEGESPPHGDAPRAVEPRADLKLPEAPSEPHEVDMILLYRIVLVYMIQEGHLASALALADSIGVRVPQPVRERIEAERDIVEDQDGPLPPDVSLATEPHEAEFESAIGQIFTTSLAIKDAMVEIVAGDTMAARSALLSRDPEFAAKCPLADLCVLLLGFLRLVNQSQSLEAIEFARMHLRPLEQSDAEQRLLDLLEHDLKFFYSLAVTAAPQDGKEGAFDPQPIRDIVYKALWERQSLPHSNIIDFYIRQWNLVHRELAVVHHPLLAFLEFP